MRKWYPLLLVIAAIVASVIAYPKLPDRVPIHWNFRGQIDGYGSKWMTLVLLPGVLIGLWALLRALPKADPFHENYAKMSGTYDLVVNAGLTVLAAAHLAVLGTTLGLPIDMKRAMPLSVGVLFVVIGNVLPRARRNFWFGIRTPWTLMNERVWERTHRVGGYAMVGAGILCIAAAFLPVDVAAPTLVVVGGAAALGLVLYSYVAWRQETSR
jgi:uncharacterized membrane protein